jgi:coenzyme F420-reducing hydrogenase beta subunit
VNDKFGYCDGCGACAPLDELSLVTFTEGEGFVCDDCKRETVVVSLASDKRLETK